MNSTDPLLGSICTSSPESDHATPPPESDCTSPTPKPTARPQPTSKPQLDPTAYYYMSSKGTKLCPNTSSLTPYKPLPEGWDQSEHHWLYGWPANDRRFQSILPKCFNRPISGTTPHDSLSDATLVWGLVEELVMYKLTYYICKPNEDGLKEGIVVKLPFGSGIPFAMISCTVNRRAFMRRPTVNQMRTLTRIFGEPRWLECYQTKENFLYDDNDYY